jgi:hypothetical protein
MVACSSAVLVNLESRVWLATPHGGLDFDHLVPYENIAQHLWLDT